MAISKNITSLHTAALMAGIALLFMAIAAPIAEMVVYPRLVVPGEASVTVKNIIMHESLFRAGIFCYLITFICDIIAAWALFILLKPVNENLSQLTAWFRLIYAVIALAALINLINILRFIKYPEYFTFLKPDQLYAQVRLSLSAFRNGWSFGILFFGIHLWLLGYLVLKSDYIPKILGILLIIAGLGYLTNALRPLLFPGINLNFAKFTFYGELIFMLWLLIKGSKIKETDKEFI